MERTGTAKAIFISQISIECVLKFDYQTKRKKLRRSMLANEDQVTPKPGDHEYI